MQTQSNTERNQASIRKLFEADEDRVVVYNATTGTHTGAFMGMAATGRKFKAIGVDVFRFNGGGRIVEHWGVFDTFGMLRQLGLQQVSRDG